MVIYCRATYLFYWGDENGDLLNHCKVYILNTYLRNHPPYFVHISYLVAHIHHQESRRNVYTDTEVAVRLEVLNKSSRILFQIESASTLLIYIWIKNDMSKITIQGCSLKRQVFSIKTLSFDLKKIKPLQNKWRLYHISIFLFSWKEMHVWFAK